MRPYCSSGLWEWSRRDAMMTCGTSRAWILGLPRFASKHTSAQALVCHPMPILGLPVAPQHNALVEAMLQSPCHVVATMRSKTAYELSDDGNGKKKPIKIGLAPVQRPGMEYEFTVVLDLSIERHIATATKDRTSLFDGQHFIPTPATGEALRAWLEAGKDPADASRNLLKTLTVQVDRIEAVPPLEEWWRAHRAEIEALMPEDLEALKRHCAARKAAILEALRETEAEREAISHESAPLQSTPAPTVAVPRRGNGRARAAA